MFADELRKLRLAAGLSQEDVAAAAGVTREHVSRLERGLIISPTVDVFIRLCRAANASPSDVIATIERSVKRPPHVPARSATRR